MAYIHIIDNINSHVSNCLSVCLSIFNYVGLLQTITIMKYQLWDIYNLDIYILHIDMSEKTSYKSISTIYYLLCK